MSVREIPFGRPWITDEDRRAVQSVLEGSVLVHGPVGEAFEHEFGAFVGGNPHCLAVSSCTAALHLAVLALELGPGDDVLVPALSHVATAHVVDAVGARPIFVDCDPRTGNVDPAALERAWTPRTRALLVVHLLGAPCEMDRILALAQRRALPVIEDCSLALGARWNGTHVGLLGDVGCFSFYPRQHITSGEGGMLVTRRSELARRLEKLRSFGLDASHAERRAPGMYDVFTPGLNYRMSELAAALGRSQLTRIEENLAHRRRVHRSLERRLAELDWVRVLSTDHPSASSSHHSLELVLQGPFAAAREKLVHALGARGIGTSIYYPHPVPRLSYYRNKYGWGEGDFPRATEIADRCLALPVGLHVCEEDALWAADVLSEALEGTWA